MPTPSILVPFLVGFVLASCLSGCDEVAEAFDCADLCEEVKKCETALIDRDECNDQCFDRVEKSKSLREAVDECTDCLEDQDTCAEVQDRCPMCRDVSTEILGKLGKNPFMAPTADGGMPDAN